MDQDRAAQLVVAVDRASKARSRPERVAADLVAMVRQWLAVVHADRRAPSDEPQ